MAQNHKRTSPYYDTPLAPGGSYLDLWEPRDIGEDANDEIYEVEAKYAGRPDLLAEKHYQDPNFWWVFMVANPDVLVDPLTDLQEGVRIRIPDPARVLGGLT